MYFDNYFSSLDLIVHLKNIGLKAAGTVRQDRVYQMKKLGNKEKKETVSASLIARVTEAHMSSNMTEKVTSIMFQ